MQKIEYEQRKLEIEATIKALKEELNQLQDEFISHHRIFADFEKVKIITKAHPYWTSESMNEPAGICPEETRYAFVVGYDVHMYWGNTVMPKLKKCKKDGSISKVDDYFNPRFETIESIKQTV